MRFLTNNVAHRIPYSDVHDASDEEKAVFAERQEPLSFGHTLEDLLGGQIAAGFAITGFYEDVMPESSLNQYISSCAATRAVKLRI